MSFKDKNKFETMPRLLHQLPIWSSVLNQSKWSKGSAVSTSENKNSKKAIPPLSLL